MAILSNDKTYVTVVRGDTLWDIAKDYLGSGTKYPTLASINNIKSPYYIYVDQKIYLKGVPTSSGGSNAGNSGGSTNTSKPVSNKAKIDHFGLQSDSDTTLFAMWSWSKDNTDKYQVKWEYYTANGVWFVGSSSSNSVDKEDPNASKQSTYSIPENATKVRFKVKPISKTYTQNDTETSYWTAEWSTEKTFNVSETPPQTPSAPSVKIEDLKLTATLDNVDPNKLNATSIQFQVVKDDSTVFNTGTAKIVTNSASYSCTVTAGSKYKVRCRSVRNSEYSKWTDYSSNAETAPSGPSKLTSVKATSETSVYLSWAACKTAKTYEIEYSTKKEYFDGSDQTTKVSGIEFTHYEKTGLETGQEYFFRVRAVNDSGESGWSSISSVVIGKEPAAPTTWSSSTTVITGETVVLYWVHNAEDGSSQTYADLELYIGGMKETHTLKNTTDEDEKDKTSFYEIDTKNYKEGTTIQWRVRTAGITKAYGDWSIQRVIDVYAQPTLEMRVTDISENIVETLTSFPFYVYALAGPNTQQPIGYQLTITSNDIYESVDNIGNSIVVNAGDEVYSRYFDIKEPLLIEMSANNINLENNIRYTVKCVVSMDSGLNAEATTTFTVSWQDTEYSINAEISIDPETLVAYIRPYCLNYEMNFYLVSYNTATRTYITSSRAVEITSGEPVVQVISETEFVNTYTETGEQVFVGETPDDETVYYCTISESHMVEDISLSVYRRTYDGKFIEIATGLNNLSNTFVTDPHPALDYARYRVIAISNSTGAVSYYDVPGYPVGEKSVIIQWNEDWTNFDTTAEEALQQPPWSGSMLKIPYNIDVSDNYKPDVALIEYIGRSHPVSYYGTQLGVTANWNMEIPKKDIDTLYALRRLSVWMGDVYVREPSGSGYWANITVSYSQKHRELTIPVTLSVTRVEGGM